MATTRNPQDATRRNVQAANKRLSALERRVREIEGAIVALAFALVPPKRPRRAAR